MNKDIEGMVLPVGNKTKELSSVEGAGHVGSMYPDTNEMIQRDQKKGDSQAKAHPMKLGYRY